ncbi:1-phosphofructokinase [Neobacillus cucumis]|uniref:1-phosphofructokinase n=1 Tax=Neobacillus cucumis TaxID=1740721 RepID=UPI00203BD9A7|nr:1-phosphofructokinase [Neobacillus cucumis]MCM3729370.1 1-phosphofructokinase [Neobacillus cucumis]
MERPNIATVTLNPAIDTAYRLERIVIGSVVRTQNPLKSAGGKGLNVTRVATLLGEKVIATGFVGGQNGQFIRQQLENLEVIDRFVQIEGETRQCLAFLDNMNNQTEILEEGPVIKHDEQEYFKKQLHIVLENIRVLVISGSLPKGISVEFYQFIIKEAAKQKIKLILDTSGLTLTECLAYQPFMIKPNREELEQILNRTLSMEEDIWQAMEAIQQKGIELIVVSDGSNGSYALYNNSRYKVSTASISTVNAVGSGDSFVAGVATGFARSMPIEEVLALASACGAANAMEDKTGFIKLENVNKILKEIKVEKK